MPTERAGRSPKAKGQRDSEGGLERRVELEWMKQYVLISILYSPPCLGVYGGSVLCIRIALRLDLGERQLIYKKKVNNARNAAGKSDERIGDLAHKAGEQIDEARERFNANVDSIDRKVEEKAAEAKGGLSGWFGGGGNSGKK